LNPSHDVITCIRMSGYRILCIEARGQLWQMVFSQNDNLRKTENGVVNLKVQNNDHLKGISGVSLFLY